MRGPPPKAPRRCRCAASHAGGAQAPRERPAQVSLVRRAEWFEGRVRVLCEREAGSGCEVLAFDNFQPEDFDPLWRCLARARARRGAKGVPSDGDTVDTACCHLQRAREVQSDVLAAATLADPLLVADS